MGQREYISYVQREGMVSGKWSFSKKKRRGNWDKIGTKNLV